MLKQRFTQERFLLQECQPNFTYFLSKLARKFWGYSLCAPRMSFPGSLILSRWKREHGAMLVLSSSGRFLTRQLLSLNEDACVLVCKLFCSSSQESCEEEGAWLLCHASF